MRCLARVPWPSAMTCLDKVPRLSSCLDTATRLSASLNMVSRSSAMSFLGKVPRPSVGIIAHYWNGGYTIGMVATLLEWWLHY